jgi:hypothetical protein
VGFAWGGGGPNYEGMYRFSGWQQPSHEFPPENYGEYKANMI